MFAEIAMLVIMVIALIVDLRYLKEMSPIIALVTVLTGVILDHQYVAIMGILFLIIHRLVMLSIYTIKIYGSLVAFVEMVKEPLLLFLLVTMSGIISANALIPGLDRWSSSIVFLLIMLLATKNVASARIDDLSFIGDMLLRDLHDVINGIDKLSNILIAITCIITLITWRLIGLIILLGYLIAAFIGSKIRSEKPYVKNMIKLIPTLIGLVSGFIY